MAAAVTGDLRRASLSALVLGLVSAFGDWVWAHYIQDGAVLPGVIHGLLIFTLLALVLGIAAGSGLALRRLLPTLPLAGLLIAAAFYPIARVAGYLGALLLTWVAMWITLALLQRWARGGRESHRIAMVRAALAAVGSGIAFWAVSGMWTSPDPDPSYALRALAWSFAFWPGFAALLTGQARPDSQSG